jgi:putative SOS response-associated peptidase YedK
MCGRFVRKLLTQDLVSEFGVEEIIDELPPSYNVAPTHDVAVITSAGHKRLVKMRWGLIPWWATDPSIGTRMINARVETLNSKAAFKDCLATRRCLIVANGFYEWKKGGKVKIPLLIRLKSDRAFAFAGLYDIWKSPLGPPVTSCTIITTTPNELVEPIHDRMPVILSKEAETFWLDRSIEDYGGLIDVLAPYPSVEMEAYEVSSLVNSVKNDSPDLIAPATSIQHGLFG